MSKFEKLLGKGFTLAGSLVLDAAGRVSLGDTEGRPCGALPMPGGPGIYVFTNGDGIGYIGETGQTFGRRMNKYIYGFRRTPPPRPFFYDLVRAALRAQREVLIYTRTMAGSSKTEREAIEHEMIHHLQPPWNRVVFLGPGSPHTFRELAPDERPQDPTFDGSGWKFETLEHGGDYQDTMPQAIRARDAEGRSCIYVPLKVDGRVVDSLGFDTSRED